MGGFSVRLALALIACWWPSNGIAATAPLLTSPIHSLTLQAHPLNREGGWASPPRAGADSIEIPSKSGFKDKKNGCGKGEAFTQDEENEIRLCLDAIALNDYTVNDPIVGDKTYYGADIAADLGAMIDKGQMGKGVNCSPSTEGCTLSVPPVGSEGDLMNICASTATICDPQLCAVLAHEWMHTQQSGLSANCRQAQAYTLHWLVYLMCGGTYDSYWTSVVNQALHYSALCAAGSSPLGDGSRDGDELTTQVGKLPDSDAPNGGGSTDNGSFGNSYRVDQSAGKVFLWRNSVELIAFEPLSLHLFFRARHIAMPDRDVVLVFGSDTTTSSSPVGMLTVFSADATHFFDRQDITLNGTKHPCGVDYDSATGRWYVLDAHLSGSGITIWTDTNGDGTPETRLPAPFAPLGFPGLQGAISVAVGEHPTLGSGVIVAARDLQASGWRDNTEAVTFLRDTNNDAVADVSTTVPLMDFMDFPPTITQLPIASQTQLQVFGMPNHTLEVWKCSASGDVLFERLGSVTGSETGVNTVLLTTPLVAGWHIEVIDATLGARLPLPDVVGGAVTVASPAAALVIGRVQPNPARRLATLRFELPRPAFVRGVVYDLAGRVVARLADGLRETGVHTLKWTPAHEVGSGVYFLRLTIGDQTFKRTVIIAE